MYKKYLNRLNEAIQKAKEAKLVLSKIKTKRKSVNYEYDYTIARSNYDWMLNKVNIYKELIIDLGADPVYINYLTENIRRIETYNIKDNITGFLKNKIDEPEWIEFIHATDYNIDSFCEMIAEEWVKRDRVFNPESISNQKGIITFAKAWIKNINK